MFWKNIKLDGFWDAINFTIFLFAKTIKFILGPSVIIALIAIFLIALLNVFLPSRASTYFPIPRAIAISSEAETGEASYPDRPLIDIGWLLRSAKSYTSSFFSQPSFKPVDVFGASDAIGSWLSSCESEKTRRDQEADAGNVQMASQRVDYFFPDSPPLSTLISQQSSRLINQIDTSREELTGMRTTSYVYLTVGAVVGFLTTVVAAVNAWATMSTIWGGIMKLLGVCLPAAGTLLVALASIYAPADTVSRKAQLVSGLITLQAELAALTAESGCIKVLSSDPDVSKNFGDWNKRFAAAMAAAELSQNPGTTGRETQQPARDNGAPKPGTNNPAGANPPAPAAENTAIQGG